LLIMFQVQIVITIKTQTKHNQGVVLIRDLQLGC
jgi:hypothetical protein